MTDAATMTADEAIVNNEHEEHHNFLSGTAHWLGDIPSRTKATARRYRRVTIGMRYNAKYQRHLMERTGQRVLDGTLDMKNPTVPPMSIEDFVDMSSLREFLDDPKLAAFISVMQTMNPEAVKVDTDPS